MSAYTRDELLALGIPYVGQGVKVSRKVSIYNPGKIRIGDFSRIDDFCVLSAGEGGIEIGRNVHIAIFVSLIGAANIKISDFAGLSSRVSVYSSNDDYSGAFLTNPTIPKEFTNVSHGPVSIGRHAIVGSGSVILPNVTLHDGVAIGALSMANRDCEAFGVYTGVPARLVKSRKTTLLELEAEYLAQESNKETG